MSNLSNEQAEKFIKMDDLRELRARTHLSLAVCSDALKKSESLEQAIEFLQKQGSIKKVDQVVEMKEGLVLAVVQHDLPQVAFIIEALCQTDFAAKSEIFKNFVTSLFTTDQVEAEDDNSLSLVIDPTKVNLVSQQLGEKVVIKRVQVLEPSGWCSTAVAYTHHNDKMAVLLLVDDAAHLEQEKLAEGESPFDHPEVMDFLQECAMQIAANNPLGLNRADVAGQEAAARLIFEEQVPPKAIKMKDKIVQGKVDKWYVDSVLIDQESLIQPGRTIQQLKSELEAKFGTFEFGSFVRYELGC